LIDLIPDKLMVDKVPEECTRPKGFLVFEPQLMALAHIKTLENMYLLSFLFPYIFHLPLQVKGRGENPHLSRDKILHLLLISSNSTKGFM